MDAYQYYYYTQHANDVHLRTPLKQKQIYAHQPIYSRRPRSKEHSGMDLSYVTERIIALWFPAEISNNAFQQGEQQAAHMLHSKHANSYMIFNLSEPRRVTRSQHERVREFGWPPDLAPPLERLCCVCKEIDTWLSGDSHRIAVLHAKGNKERIGVVVAAYMRYSNICGSADQALDRFAMKRFLDDKIGDLEQPSHRRYVDYFSGLLSGSIIINSAPLYLTHVTVLGAPSFEGGSVGGSKAFLKVYEGLVPVYTSGVHSVAGDTKQFTVNVAGERRRGLQLRGDILLKCYHRHYYRDSDSGDSPSRSITPQSSGIGECQSPQRELIFACQFHTCAVTDYTLSFTRQELDSASNDLRFPLDGAVELHFSPTPEGVRLPTPAPTPAVPVDLSSDPVTLHDSYENLFIDSDLEDNNDGEVVHTYGPLDGSLYATVSKKQLEAASAAGVSPSAVGVSVPASGGGAVISSIHTVSMDSGISSAGNGLLNPPTDHHRALDELLNDMLLIVENIPDLKPGDLDECPHQDDIPYHARQDSRPFTYGSVPTDSMLGLSSPGLVRKASLKGEPPRDLRRSTSVPSARSPDFHEGSIVTGSMSQHSSNELTWLQRQQAKLRERKEVALRTERLPTESNLLSELRSVLRPTPSHRFDGYTSDTTLFADEDEDDFYRPLHINTVSSSNQKITNGNSAPGSPLLPNRTSSRSRVRHNSNERPFVAVKRAHEERRKYSENSSSPETTPERYIVGLPMSCSIGNDSDGLLSLAESERNGIEKNQNGFQTNGVRDESYTTWRTTSTSDDGHIVNGPGSPTLSSSPRPQTPAFPVHPRTPYVNNSVQFDSSSMHTVGLPPKSPTAQRKEWSPLSETLQRELSTSSNGTLRGYESSDNQHSPKSPFHQNGVSNGGQISPSVYYGHSRRSSIHSNGEPPQEVSPAHVKFVRDTSRFWYKPTISREEAIALLRDRPPGSFVVRDSNSFPGAFGLALKVSMPPPNSVNRSPSSDPASELVRHFLIEPTSRGVRLKGCPNEPVFSSLSALVYQHSLMPLALPCRLALPETDSSRLTSDTGTISTAQLLLAQGAACNVLYLLTVETESLTGPQAVVRAVAQLFSDNLPTAAVVHFKVSGQGITLTDNKRQLFFRRHYPVGTISHCGLDPDDHRWSQHNESTRLPVSSNRIFGFVAKKPASNTDNQCHLFAELEPEQPATAIVNFVSKVMMNSVQGKQNIV